jgi:hypothetical protein
MIESNNYVIKLPLKFDISSTFDMKAFAIYKTQQSLPNDPFETSDSFHWHKMNILVLLWMHKLFLPGIAKLSKSQNIS